MIANSAVLEKTSQSALTRVPWRAVAYGLAFVVAAYLTTLTFEFLTGHGDLVLCRLYLQGLPSVLLLFLCLVPVAVFSSKVVLRKGFFLLAGGLIVWLTVSSIDFFLLRDQFDSLINWPFSHYVAEYHFARYPRDLVPPALFSPPSVTQHFVASLVARSVVYCCAALPLFGVIRTFHNLGKLRRFRDYLTQGALFFVCGLIAALGPRFLTGMMGDPGVRYNWQLCLVLLGGAQDFVFWIGFAVSTQLFLGMYRLNEDLSDEVSQEAIVLFVKALKDPNQSLRTVAAQELGRMGPVASRAIPDLNAALEDSNEEVRQAVADALRRIQHKQETEPGAV